MIRHAWHFYYALVSVLTCHASAWSLRASHLNKALAAMLLVEYLQPKESGMNNVKALTQMIMILMMLTGCSSTIDSFYNRHVVEDKLEQDTIQNNEIGTLSVTAQRRLIIGNLKSGNFCSEPPPEVADTVTSALAAALNANISSDKKISAELASNFARHVNQLYRRAHTVQLFRDASYHLCVNAVNTSNGQPYESYKQDLVQMISDLKGVLKEEVKQYYEVEKLRAQNPPSIYQETIVCDTKAELDDKGNEESKLLSTDITCRPLSMQKENSEASKEPNK